MIINFQKNSNHSILNIQNEKRQSDKLIIIEFKQFKRLSDTIVIKRARIFIPLVSHIRQFDQVEYNVLNISFDWLKNLITY